MKIMVQIIEVNFLNVVILSRVRRNDFSTGYDFNMCNSAKNVTKFGHEILRQ